MSLTITFETVELLRADWPLLIVTACEQDGQERATAEVFIVDPEDRPITGAQFRLPGPEAKQTLLGVTRLATLQDLRSRLAELPPETRSMDLQLVPVDDEWVRAATALSKYPNMFRIRTNTEYDELSAKVAALKVSGLWRNPIG